MGIAALLGMAVAGCAITPAGPRHVNLSLVAPTDGATVYVSTLFVVGHVSPDDARVLVGGRRAVVHRGMFRLRIQLPLRVNHIAILAAARGYLPASLTTSVRVSRPASTSARPARSPQPQLRQIAPCACLGYLWRGHVSSVSATWRVPYLSAATTGLSATWIGAESPDGFIQIGTNQGRLLSPPERKAGVSAAQVPATRYAFWSDTAHGFRPLPLGSVKPGDTVHASLTLVRGRWRLRIEDAQSVLSVQFSTSEEAAHPPTQAEWLQEDPEDSKSGRPFPYPRLSAITFRDMRVDQGPPKEPAVLPAVSHRANLGSLGPMRDNAFTISP